MSSFPDKRIYPRFKFLVEAKIKTGKEENPCQTFNLSAGGLCFVVTRSLPIGDAVFIDSKLKISFMGKILEVGAPHRDGTRRCRFAFTNPLTDEEVQYLIHRSHLIAVTGGKPPATITA